MHTIRILHFILTPFFITTQMLPMENKKPLQKLWKKLRDKKTVTQQQTDLCWLALLPKDIQDHIAEYLIFHDRETDGECVERTKNIPRGSPLDGYINYLNIQVELQNRMEYDISYGFVGRLKKVLTLYNTRTKKTKTLYRLCNEPSFDTLLFSCSADCSKVIISPNSTEITIVNLVTDKTVTNKYKNQTVSSAQENEHLKPINYYTIAISNDGNLIAQIFSKYHDTTNTAYPFEPYKYYCTLFNVDGSRYKSFTIGSGQDSIKSVAFNKQATKLVAHYDNNDHLLMPLCSEQEHRTKSKKTLIDYLRQRGVCKNLTSSLPAS